MTASLTSASQTNGGMAGSSGTRYHKVFSTKSCSKQNKPRYVKTACRRGFVESVVDAFLKNLIDGLTFSVCLNRWSERPEKTRSDAVLD